jgi:phage gp36-like protein
MNAITANAIEISLPPPPLTKFEREKRAFERLLPTLLSTHRGQYVAIHNEQVADHGNSRLEVALRVLKKVGNVDIYVGLASEHGEPVSRSGVRRDLSGPKETVE